MVLTSETFFIDIDDMFAVGETINTNKIISILPNALNTTSKLKYLNAFGKNINYEQYIAFLNHITHGGDHISFDYLIKIHGLELSPVNNMIIFNDVFKYKDIKPEPLFIWWILRALKNDSFISKYMNDNSKMNTFLQQKIEADILPTTSNFRFDLGFPVLNILVEVNEYYHEKKLIKINNVDDENLMLNINDGIKKALAILCGHTAILVREKEVFDMDEAAFKKLSDDEIHQILANSKHLKKFLVDFIYSIKCALVKFLDVRQDYILRLFKIELNNQRQSCKQSIKIVKIRVNKFKTLYNEAPHINELGILKNTAENITKFKTYLNLIKSNELKLHVIESILNGLNDSKIFMNLFNIKHKCVNAPVNQKNIITFTDIITILNVKKHLHDFKIFVLQTVPRISNRYTNEDDIFSNDDNFIHQDDILITWEELSEIIDNYDNSSIIKDMLKMYYREIGRSYEIIIAMNQAHNDKLYSNREDLITYTNHLAAQHISLMETEKNKNKTLIDKNKNLVDDKIKSDKEIVSLNKRLRDLMRYDDGNDNINLNIDDIKISDPINLEVLEISKVDDDTFLASMKSKLKKLNTTKVETVAESESD